MEGRVVQIAFQNGFKATVDFRRIMLKRLTHTGSTLRARSVGDKAAIARQVETHRFAQAIVEQRHASVLVDRLRFEGEVPVLALDQTSGGHQQAMSWTQLAAQRTAPLFCYNESPDPVRCPADRAVVLASVA